MNSHRHRYRSGDNNDHKNKIDSKIQPSTTYGNPTSYSKVTTTTTRTTITIVVGFILSYVSVLALVWIVWRIPLSYKITTTKTGISTTGSAWKNPTSQLFTSLRLLLFQGSDDGIGGDHGGQVADTSSTSISTASTNFWGLLYMIMLSIQFAIQPIVTKQFIPSNGKILRSSIIIAQDLVKIVVALILWYVTTRSSSTITETTMSNTYTSNTTTSNTSWFTFVYKIIIIDTISVATIPAGLGVIQNYCTLIACQQLQPIAYSAISQTKTVFAALCCYLLVQNQYQSFLQVVSLLLMILSALFMEGIVSIHTVTAITDYCYCYCYYFYYYNHRHDPTLVVQPNDSTTPTKTATTKTTIPVITTIKSIHTFFTSGLVAALSASFLSGLTGAITQRSLQQQQYSSLSSSSSSSTNTNPFIYSAQLSAVSCIIAFLSSTTTTTAVTTISTKPHKNNSTGSSTTTSTTCTNNTTMNRVVLHIKSLLQGWNSTTWIPVVNNAIGGILVGLVVKHCGAVRKGFACIVGMFISGILQNILSSYHIFTTSETTSTKSTTNVQTHSSNHPTKNSNSNESNILSSSSTTNRTVDGTTTRIVGVTNQQWIGGILAAISLWMHTTFPYQSNSKQ